MAESRRRDYVIAGVGLLAAAGVMYFSKGSSTTSKPRIDEVDISTSGSGSVLVNGQPAPAKLEDADGTKVTFQAVSASGWQFSHWQGTGGSSTENPLSVVLNAPAGNIQAVFLQTTGGGGGGSGGGGGGATYRVVSGDTLWGIAERFYGNGAEWPKIYTANAAQIEATARAHGFASSDTGHWIFPGEVFVIP